MGEGEHDSERISLGGTGVSLTEFIGKDIRVVSLSRREVGKFGPSYNLGLDSGTSVLVVENSISGNQLKDGVANGKFAMPLKSPIVLAVEDAGTGSKGQRVPKFA